MINREFQLQVLEGFKKGRLEKTELNLQDINYKGSIEEVEFNIRYLNELGLLQGARIKTTLYRPIEGTNRAVIDPSAILLEGRVTAKGVDFLEDDGGVSAVLGTVTVKLHADTIRDLIDAKIIESTAIPEQEKPALREALKGMKEEGLKQLTTRLISYGLDQGTVTAQQLTQWFSS